jgi:hypothetical protein
VAAAPQPAPPPRPAVSIPPIIKPDERITAFVEAMRIKSVRVAGADSRVLINDRVYRVGEVVDRPLGVRLSTVTANQLTFSDANGTTYVKYL